MNLETQTIRLRRLKAGDGMVITDKKTKTMRAKEVYLAKGESEDNFMEIDENTLPPENNEQSEPPGEDSEL